MVREVKEISSHHQNALSFHSTTDFASRVNSITQSIFSRTKRRVEVSCLFAIFHILVNLSAVHFKLVFCLGVPDPSKHLRLVFVLTIFLRGRGGVVVLDWLSPWIFKLSQMFNKYVIASNLGKFWKFQTVIVECQIICFSSHTPSVQATTGSDSSSKGP